jgi:hypothetical protein
MKQYEAVIKALEMRNGVATMAQQTDDFVL